MKQKRTKPRSTRPKGKRWPSSSEEWHAYIEDCALLDDEDWARDVKEREYKKSDKYKQGQQLADQFKKRVK